MRQMSEALPFIDQAQAGLVRHFGLTAFRSRQAEVVSSVLSGRNTVVVMPTGAGKSLCYQLPATLLPGITLVVSPLIALMKDQVEQLNAKGISATLINSTLTDLERADRQRRMRQGEYKLVYVAPERFRSGAFLDAVQAAQVELFAIDEAHCISQWGHDFRPDYAVLGQVRKKLRPPRTVALTATATPEVRQDIVRSLLLKDPQVFVAGFDRSNLFLEVVPVGGDDDRREVCESLVSSGGSGLIYCSTRKAAETLHIGLKARGRTAVVYHAGMDDNARRRAQDTFMAKDDAIAVATNAFGMGIDKPNIRFVAHANIPKAVEAYYQEIGRAGRDGNPAHAVLLFNHSDVFTQERLIQSSHPPDVVFADLWAILQEVEEFNRGVELLAAQIGASEFEVSAALKVLEREGKITRSSRGEGAFELKVTAKAAHTHPRLPDAVRLLEVVRAAYPEGQRVKLELNALARRSGLPSEEVRHALTALERSGAVDVRRPFAGKTIRALERVPFHALGLDLTRVREQERRALLLLRRMTDYAYAKRCRRAFLLSYFGEQGLNATCDGCDVCRGPRMARKAATPRAREKPTPNAPENPLAVEELRRFRRELSKDLGIPPFIIFNDATLFAFASALPTNREEFLAVKGAGEARWERFGPKVVEICVLARAAGHAPAAVTTARRRTR